MRRNKPFIDWSGSLEQNRYMLNMAIDSISNIGSIIGVIASNCCANGINASELYKCSNIIKDVCRDIRKFDLDLSNVFYEASYKHTKRDMKKRNKG